ncbi:MAG: hypothetical protein CL912_21835 [Deltaproteobacteria bacterium]|nr:hypothetical protein [Deltaproteobacteria bacterium]
MDVLNAGFPADGQSERGSGNGEVGGAECVGELDTDAGGGEGDVKGLPEGGVVEDGASSSL